MNATRIMVTMSLIAEFTQFKWWCIDISMAVDSSCVNINSYNGTFQTLFQRFKLTSVQFTCLSTTNINSMLKIARSKSKYFYFDTFFCPLESSKVYMLLIYRIISGHSAVVHLNLQIINKVNLFRTTKNHNHKLIMITPDNVQFVH